MKPRLGSSKKWTPFPAEFSEQVREAFHQNFNDLVSQGSFHIEGRIYTEEILLRVGYRKNGGLRQANFEVSLQYSQQKQDAVEKIHYCIDAAASMLLEYIEKDGDVDFPLLWKEFPFQEQRVFLQYSTVNTDLESQANKLLGEADASLVQEGDEFEGEDALTHAEIDEELSGGDEIDLEDKENFQVDDEDEETENDGNPEDKGPRLFGKPRKKKTPLH